MKNNIKLYLGDSKEVLKKLEINSIDTVITDPPYGLSFMGKKWDYNVPSVELWKEVLRVLKPGGTALIFAGSRTQHRMAVNVEDAGFILKDCIMWLYGTGFPKATDISKQLDKGVERKVVGKAKSGAKETHNSSLNMSQVDNNTFGGEYNITEPTTPEARIWAGYKSHGLKPAYEPILVAMKPNEGTYTQNALKYGVAGLNIDGARIEYSEDNKPIPQLAQGKTAFKTDNKMYGRNSFTESKTKSTIGGSLKGRFPANIILDEEAAKLLDKQTGTLKSGDNCKRTKEGRFLEHGGLGKEEDIQITYGDKGGVSRFFYCAKASKAERNKGCEKLEKKQKIFNGQSNNSSKDLKDVEERFTTKPCQNYHPTVKPLKLMEYLCILTKTPIGGIVLDPFMGSGTTGMACKKTGRKFIGIELSEEYMKIAVARIKGEK